MTSDHEIEDFVDDDLVAQRFIRQQHRHVVPELSRKVALFEVPTDVEVWRISQTQKEIEQQAIPYVRKRLTPPSTQLPQAQRKKGGADWFHCAVTVL